MKEYKSKLILFPIHSKKMRKGDSSVEDCKKATQLEGRIMPVKKASSVRIFFNFDRYKHGNTNEMWNSNAFGK